MAAEPEILDELRRLRSRVPYLTGALAATVDGLVLAQDTPGVEPESMAALTAAALGIAVRLADTAGQGDFRELAVRCAYGYVATYSAGRTAVLTLLAQDRVTVGRLHLEGRRSGIRIGELVDSRTPVEPPVKPAAAPRTTTARSRTARPPRTANARTSTES
ncbi:roadblock/LC7 domain-containing protein [Streptomyces sp. NPDC090106]|uniref:roadblock/LC7 domain-containing protein n=1 Tax=Streptomyces sp. NPDC090106 TaxID=3365946 RepID=UPI0038219DCA